ncbi:hypothetical protein EVAR_66991_1 [Eumeta japonica]|uniref:Uncharacterized protein n=1 Tax=Eumeta variegata TaxID=151549 RepID=A0A4C1ZRR2_EUMVA|nr:hypothetical protein EVAR_66991_1 [Eumeta japonica]
MSKSSGSVCLRAPTLCVQGPSLRVPAGPYIALDGSGGREGEARERRDSSRKKAYEAVSGNERSNRTRHITYETTITGNSYLVDLLSNTPTTPYLKWTTIKDEDRDCTRTRYRRHWLYKASHQRVT